MKPLARILMISLLTPLLGCLEDGKELREVKRAISQYPDLLLTTQAHPFAEVEGLTARICGLPIDKQKDDCFRMWADALFSFDLTRIPVEDSERTFRCVLLMENFAASKMYRHRAMTFSEKYESRFRHLEWLQRQIRLVRPPRTYPKGVQMRWDSNGRANWASCPKEDPGRDCYRKSLARYTECVKSFNAEALWCEVTLSGDETFNETKEERATVKARLAVRLGRKLRTKEEAAADSKEKRHRDYPDLVPTPDGLVECWTQSEDEKVRRKPICREREVAK